MVKLWWNSVFPTYSHHQLCFHQFPIVASNIPIISHSCYSEIPIFPKIIFPSSCFKKYKKKKNIKKSHSSQVYSQKSPSSPYHLTASQHPSPRPHGYRYQASGLQVLHGQIRGVLRGNAQVYQGGHQHLEDPYPLVNIQKAIENGHRNSWFTH